MPITAQNAPTKTDVMPVIENQAEIAASARAAVSHFRRLLERLSLSTARFPILS
jgi:hypothetical protein